MEARYPHPLIASKVVPPRTHRDHVIPEELLARLEPSAHVTLLIAPAGFGKTTLLAEWLGGGARPLAWLSLDELDDDPDSLLGYLVAAFRAVDPEACGRTLALATQSGAMRPPWPVLIRSLLGDVEAMPEPFVLALDDVHHLADPDCLALIGELIQHRPAGMWVALASRSELSGSLTRLQAQGEVCEVGIQDLQWSQRASAAFLMRAARGRMDWATARELAAESDGWIAALRLAALYVGQGGDASDLGTRLRGPQPNWHALAYLAEEVLDRQPSEVQEFLQRAAIPDRFCAALCGGLDAEDGVRGVPGELLEYALQEQLFVLPLDGAAESGERWYRFHHLFRELLLQRLRSSRGPEGVAALHGRAARWLGGRGLVEEALGHLLEIGDEEGIVELVEERRQEAMNLDEWSRTERWLRLLPRETIERHPELVLCEAWAFMSRFRWEDLPDRVDRASALLRDERRPGRAEALRGELETLRSQIHFRAMDLARAKPHAERALELCPRRSTTVRSIARASLGGCLLAGGDLEGATRLLYEGLKEQEAEGGSATLPLVSLAFLHWMRLDLTSLRQTMSRLLNQEASGRSSVALGWGHYFRACERYAVDDLVGARDDFRLVAERRVQSTGATYSQCVFGLASACLALGEHEEALSAIEQLFAHALETLNTELQADAQVFRALLSLRQGDPEDAMRRIAPYLPGLSQRPMYLFFVTPLTLLHVLPSLPSPELQAAAAPILNRLLAASRATHNLRIQVEALALAAVHREQEGDEAGADEALREALGLAAPGGYVRAFVDLRPELDPVLARLSPSATREGFIEAIIAATPYLPAREDEPDEGPGEAHGVGERERPADAFVGLTYRELDVLGLLCERKTNREIAQELGVSPETVKSHAASLYRKLGVRNRREAAALARDEGFEAR